MPWTYSSTDLTDLFSEKAEHDNLKLVFRTGDVSTLRDFSDSPGKFEVQIDDDGFVYATDLAGGNNTFTLSPPSERGSLRVSRDYVVDKYNERNIDQASDKYEVTIEFVPKSAKSLSTTLSETGSDWEFAFSNATVNTARVQAEQSSGSENDSDTIDLTLYLTNSQARVFEEHGQTVEAVNVREVPDGSNVVDDNNSNDRNTLTITPPSSGVVSSGDHVMLSYTTEWINSSYHKLSVSVYEL